MQFKNGKSDDILVTDKLSILSCGAEFGILVWSMLSFDEAVVDERCIFIHYIESA